TAELFFDGVRVPADNLIGEEGQGFGIRMRNPAQERLGLTVSAISAARAALRWTVEYCAQRKAFGKRILDMQHTRCTLAARAARVEIGQVFVDRLIDMHGLGERTAEGGATGQHE